MWGSKISNEGAILLKAFPKLNCLNLAWTNVTQLPALVSLTSLNMSKCTIESILDGLEEPEISLLTLHFSGASFIDAYRVLSCLHAQNLTFLDLSGSSIDNVSFLAGMNRLESLDLSCTGVIDSSMNSVADIGANLKHLNLSTTRVTSDALAILAGNVPKLEFISLSHTMVDDNALAYLGLISALRNISLSFTNIKGIILAGNLGIVKVEISGNLISFCCVQVSFM
jgi:Leucine-rich repeat (LRR) protein